jgi:hypothetical protein
MRFAWPTPEDEIREQLADQVEQAGPPLCDCGAADSSPVSPRHGEPVSHRCDCAAVLTSARIREDFSRTRHAWECGCAGLSIFV